MSGRGQSGSWGPARQLHVNVFRAISSLAIIPVASSNKYRHGLKSPSGRQAGSTEECVDGGLAINKPAGTPSHRATAVGLACKCAPRGSAPLTPCQCRLGPWGRGREGDAIIPQGALEVQGGPPEVFLFNSV